MLTAEDRARLMVAGLTLFAIAVICGLLAHAQPDKLPTPSTTERKD